MQEGISDTCQVGCIICGKTLRSVSEEYNQPYGGTAFATSGHYGSTVFDPMDGTSLEINICDDCLKKAGAAGLVLIGTPLPQPIAPRAVRTLWRAD